MYCHNCGKQIKDGVAFCPYCGAKTEIKQTETPEAIEKQKPKQDTASEQEKPLSKKEAKKQHKADKKAAKKARRKEKWKKLTFGQKLRKFFLKLLLKLILFAILAIGGCGLMVYYGFLDIPIVDELLNKIGVISCFEFEGQDINKSYIPNSENIVYQNESHSFGYVNNMILAFFNASTSEEEINEAVNSVNGKVIGRIEGINQYQIQVEPMESEELDAVCEFLMKKPNVRYAIIDTVITMDINSIPNDPWKDTFQGFYGVDWDENNPGGYNWWIEAVRVPSAWEYNDALNPINVGIVDNGFDTKHEDLDLTVLNSEVNNAENHGTHVAGVIGATINNKVGISGILSKKNLYCVDCYATPKQKKSNIAVSSLMDGIVTCLDNNCKVINMSSGIEFTSKDETAECAKESARYATIYLFAMLDSYADFIIVQSAGNGNKADIGVDAHKYNGYFTSIDDDIIQSVLEEFKNEEVVLNRDITAEDVRNAYIIVGAMDIKKKKNNWQLSKFSNYGNALTICAPGVDVFSTIVSGGIDGSYGNMDGTSMAAPIVSGITAMVWAVDPTMPSEQVRTYITDTATEVVLSRNKHDSGTYYLVNANEAVKAAINDLKNRETSEKEEQFEDPEHMSVHDQYILAYENMTKSGSWSEKLSATVPMTVSGDGQSEQGTMKMQSNTNVKGWKEDDLSNLYLEGDGNISLEGSTAYAWTMNYKNGKLKYQYTAPYAMSAEKEMDPSLFNFGELPEKTMHNAQVKDDQITFTVPGGYMAEVGLNATQMLSELDDLDYGDATVTAAINKSDWTLKNVHMKFSATMIYMDYPVSADFDITYEFGPAGEFHETDTEEDSQESGSVNPTGHQYEVYENDSVTTWEEAKAFCENLGGHLAIISSQEENDYVYNLMKESGYDSAYFGLTDKEEEGKWICVDGTPAEYVNWNSEEPSNSYDGENYAMFYYKYTDGTWNDGDFDVETQNGGHAFICEWEKM